MTYAGLHSSAALQDDESRRRFACIALAARRDDECMSRPRLAASGRIDGVAAAGHVAAPRHDDERIDGLHALQQPALSSRRRIDLVVAGSAYSTSIAANASFLYRIHCHCCTALGPGSKTK